MEENVSVDLLHMCAEEFFKVSFVVILCREKVLPKLTWSQSCQSSQDTKWGDVPRPGCSGRSQEVSIVLD